MRGADPLTSALSPGGRGGAWGSGGPAGPRARVWPASEPPAGVFGERASHGAVRGIGGQEPLISLRRSQPERLSISITIRTIRTI